MRVGDAKVFSNIDLLNAYLQLPLDDESKQYTTINTCEGLYQYNFLPFGYCSSPGIFQSFISQVLADRDNIIVYQDDILIMTETTEQHNLILDKVLNALMKAGVKINAKKTSFLADSINYLGHVFDQLGVRPIPHKVRAITEAPSPKNISQVQSFVGLCNYYHRFIPNFSKIFAPLYNLMKKNVKFR